MQINYANMKLKFKMQKANALSLSQPQNAEHTLQGDPVKEEEDASALHGLAAVAVAVEAADSKEILLGDNNNRMQDDDQLNAVDISSIKLERDESQSHCVQDLSTIIRLSTDSTNGSNSISCRTNKPEAVSSATALPVSESNETELPGNKFALDRCSGATLIPLGSKQCPVSQQQQPFNHQQVRVIKDGRFYEDNNGVHQKNSSSSAIMRGNAAAALLALNGKQDLKITSIPNNGTCRSADNPMMVANGNAANVVNVITVGGKSPLPLDTVKMKLGENDTQIFRTPMVSSTTNQSNNPSPGSNGGVVVTVESTNCSMRPPAAPPRLHLGHHGHQSGGYASGGSGMTAMKMAKQSPSSSSVQGGNSQSQPPSGAYSAGSSPEEPSSSIPDLGEFIYLIMSTHRMVIYRWRGWYANLKFVC